MTDNRGSEPERADTTEHAARVLSGAAGAGQSAPGLPGAGDAGHPGPSLPGAGGAGHPGPGLPGAGNTDNTAPRPPGTGNTHSPHGLPGMRGIDHIGITVPDLDEAERFLVDILGARHIYTLGAKQADDDWMRVTLGVHPRTVIREIRFYRLGNGSNIETFKYEAADGQAPQPRNSDIGGHHLAIYVDDLDAAIAHLRAHDVEIMGEPTASAGPAEGQRWLYFRSPWGMQFELVSYPGGKAYEPDAQVKLWRPPKWSV